MKHALLPVLVSFSSGAFFAQVEIPFESLTPEIGATVIGRRPTVRVVLKPEAPPFIPGQVLVTVDDVDVTPQLKTEGRVASWIPVAELKPGVHTVNLMVTEPLGTVLGSLEWGFALRDTKALEEVSLTIGLSESPEVTGDPLSSGDPSYRTQGNLSIDGRLLERDFESALSGNVHVMDQEGPGDGGFSPNAVELADFLIMTRHGVNRLEAGDLGIAETELTTGQAFHRRGLKLGSELLGTQFALFAVSAGNPLGFRDGLGVSDPDRRIQGFSISREVLPSEALRFRAVAVGGQSLSASSYNISSAEGAASGDVYSFMATSSLFNGRLSSELEAAFSRGDVNTEDAFAEETDQAARLKVSGNLSNFDLHGQYQRVGSNFLSLANPGLVRDRESVSVGGHAAAGPTNYSLTFSASHDNVANDRSLPLVTDQVLAANFGLRFLSSGNLSLSYSRSEQASSQEPRGFPAFKTTTSVYDAGLGYSGATWGAYLQSSFSVLDVASKAVSGTEGLNVTLGGTAWPAPFLSFSPTLGFARTRDHATGNDVETRLATLSGRTILVKEWLTLDVQGSRHETESDDGLTDLAVLNVLGRLSFSLERVLRKFGRPVISVRINHMSTIDQVTSDRVADTGAFVSLDLSAPLRAMPRK